MSKRNQTLTTAETKIKYIGILYTFVFSVLHMLAMFWVLMMLLDTHPTARELREMLTYIDKGIPIAFLASLWFGRKVGHKIITEHKSGFSVSYNTIQAVITATLTITALLIGLYEIFKDGGDHWNRLLPLGMLMVSYFVNMLPSILTGYIMGFFIKRHRKKI